MMFIPILFSLHKLGSSFSPSHYSDHRNIVFSSPCVWNYVNDMPSNYASYNGFTKSSTIVQTRKTHISSFFSSFSDDGWNSEDDVEDSSNKPNDPRIEAMRSLLESSWDDDSMGVIPSGPAKAAEAAAECIASALADGNNILMIDLRLPSYDISEGSRFYDIITAYDFCSYLSDLLRDKKLSRKSLILVRNESERSKIDRTVSRRDKKSLMSREILSLKDDKAEERAEDDNENLDDVEVFRKKLNAEYDGGKSESSLPLSTQAEGSASRSTEDAESLLDDSQTRGVSHRLWSMIGDEQVSDGADTFEKVIAAVDRNARLVEYDGTTVGSQRTLESEDALILLSPYDTADLIGIRRIVARYGRSRPIVIVNSRMESLPRELDHAVLAYAISALVARPKASNSRDISSAAPKVIVMKRYPKDWEIYVDLDGEKFLNISGLRQSSPGPVDSKSFPPIEWITRTVQAYINQRYGKQ